MSKIENKLILSTGRDEFAKAVPLGLEGFPTKISLKVGGEQKEIPVSYFEKDVLEAGDYEHPKTGERFSIEPADIDVWIDKFNQMRAQGIEIHCPVDHSDRAEDNRGFALKMRREGTKLKFTPQVFGEDGALLALRNRCSVQLTPNYIDEKGKDWGPAIEHVSFTPIPVISGQGSFVPLAASRGEQSVTKTLYLSASKGPQMDITKLREAIGAKKEDSDDVVIQQAIAKLGEGTKAAETLTLSRSKIDTFDDWKARAEKAETKVLELSRTGAPDPVTLEDRRMTGEEILTGFVERGQCSDAMAKVIRENFLGTEGKPCLLLSRGARSGEVGAVFKLLELNKALSGFQQTGGQPVPRSIPGANGEPDLAKVGVDQGKAFQEQLLAARGLK